MKKLNFFCDVIIPKAREKKKNISPKSIYGIPPAGRKGFSLGAFRARKRSEGFIKIAKHLQEPTFRDGLACGWVGMQNRKMPLYYITNEPQNKDQACFGFDLLT